MHATMIFPHLMLCKTKSESDGSNSKTIARRFKQWHKGELDELFNEGKALQICLVKSKKKKVETEARQFNKLMSTGKIYSAFANLADTSKGVLSLEENVKGQTVLMSRASKQQLYNIMLRRYNPFPLIHIRPKKRPEIYEGCHDNTWFSWTLRFGCK